MNKTKLSDTDLISAYLETGSTTRAAVKLGCSYETVRRACNRNGVPLTGRTLNGKNGRKCGGSPEKIPNSGLMNDAENMTILEIAQKYGAHVPTVDRRVRRLGLTCKTGILTGGHYSARCDEYGITDRDETITLDAVMQKQNGICQICGKAVDVSARSGRRIYGAYPTIDHIVPLSKGGTHTWDNVQLAHMSCNAAKGTEGR